jgi:hypothetical protein
MDTLKRWILTDLTITTEEIPTVITSVSLFNLSAFVTSPSFNLLGPRLASLQLQFVNMSRKPCRSALSWLPIQSTLARNRTHSDCNVRRSFRIFVGSYGCVQVVGPTRGSSPGMQRDACDHTAREDCLGFEHFQPAHAHHNFAATHWTEF